MLNILAPVLIPTLNRFEHFNRCVSSLLECEGSDQTDLFVALDFPSKDTHWEGYNKINQFIKEIHGFKSITVIKREINFGAIANILDGYNVVFKNYESLILSEDDNVFSKDFLCFMNKNLHKFKNDSNVFSICGYNYPIEIPKSYKEEIFLWAGHSAWGVGLWKDKFLKVDFSEVMIRSTVKHFFKDYKKVWDLAKIANGYIPALIEMYEKKVIHGDTYICLYQFLNNMSSVFPVVSRVRNLGHDGSGVNCGIIENSVYSKQEIYNGSSNYVISNEIQPDIKISKILERHFRQNKKSKLKGFIKLIFINMGLIK